MASSRKGQGPLGERKNFLLEEGRSLEVQAAVRVIAARLVPRTKKLENYEVDLRKLRSLKLLRELLPVRALLSHRYSRGRLRYQPVRSLGNSVVCESRLEAIRVIELDYSGELNWLSMQPFKIEERLGGQRRITHVPDLLYGLRSGEVVLENVRPPELRDEKFEKSSALAGRLAQFMGWTYRVGGSYAGAEAEMLWYLSMYAQVEPRPAVVEVLLGAFEGQSSWRLEALKVRCKLTPATYPSLLSLMWSGWLSVRLDKPLSAWSIISLGKGAA